MKRSRFLLLLPALILAMLLSVPAAAADFTDVAPTSWYAGAVDYCVDNGYFNGTSQSTFSPDGAMNRAMLVTVLHRHAGAPAPNAPAAFADVPGGTWYTAAVAWASENNIVTGYSDGKFHPDDPVTREQIMTLFHRYVCYLGDPAGTDDSRILDSFLDGDTVAAWAREPAQWCTSFGIICGNNGSMFPTASSSRAQIATVIMRLDAYLAGDLETITATADEYGAIVPAGEFRIVTGSSVLFRTEANEQCAMHAITLNDTPLTPASSYTVSSSNGPQTLCASFRPYIGDPYSGYSQLVNRSYPIDSADTYQPDDLVHPENTRIGNLTIREEAANAVDSMIGDYLEAYPESELRVQSGYRSHATQVVLYNNQIRRKGGNIYAAGVVSAVPGTSEHQLGLAVDLTTDGTLEQTFGSTPEGIWLAEHCAQYGFILRYPADKERITGIF